MNKIDQELELICKELELICKESGTKDFFDSLGLSGFDKNHQPKSESVVSINTNLRNSLAYTNNYFHNSY